MARHLNQGCGRCKKRLVALGLTGATVVSRARQPEPPADYDGILDRVLSQVRMLDGLLARERQEAPVLLSLLTSHPKGRKLLLVSNSRRFHGVGLCELLLQESWKARFDEPARTLELAEVALVVTEHLAPEVYGELLLEDLRGQVWAYLGNARRVVSDLRGAAEAFAQAETHLAKGSGSFLEHARLLEFRATLAVDQHRFEEAEALLDQAGAIYGKESQDHELGRVLLEKGNVRGYLEDYEREIDLLGQGLQLIDHSREPRAALIALHNLAHSLNQSDRSREALALLVRWRFLYLQAEDRILLLRLQWLEGQVAFNLGRFDQAEGAFKEVQRAFIEKGIGYDAALVSLELANLYLRQDRGGEVRDLVRGMLPIFRAQDMHREAAAALIVFCQAVKRDCLTAELVHEVAGFLEEARGKPGLRFEGRLADL